MGESFSAFHAAECFARVPDGSCYRRAADVRETFDTTQHILWGIYSALAGNGKRVPYPWEKGEDELPSFGSMNVEDYEKWYKSKFKESDGS